MIKYENIYKLAVIYNRLTTFKVEIFDYLKVPYVVRAKIYINKDTRRGVNIQHVLINQVTNSNYIRYPSRVIELNEGYKYIHFLQKRMYNQYNTKNVSPNIFGDVDKTSNECQTIKSLLSELNSIINVSNAYYTDFNIFKLEEENKRNFGVKI